MPNIDLKTERLGLHELDPASGADCQFMQMLLSDPGFRKNISDKGEVTLEAAAAYIDRACASSYKENDFGMYGVRELESGDLVGITGLIRRPGLDDVDLGFAFLERVTGRGYAAESGRAALDDCVLRLGLRKVSAITTDENLGSVGVLLKLGFCEVKKITLPGSEEKLNLFEWEADA
jgi:RimJ/RimL family protein N-acetyltransferase